MTQVVNRRARPWRSVRSRAGDGDLRVQSVASSLLPKSLAVAGAFVLLSSPATLQRLTGADTGAFIAVTIAFVALAAWLGWSWRETTNAAAAHGTPPVAGRELQIAAVALIATALVLVACRTWLQQILTIPHDSLRADMLIGVQAGLHRMLAGQNPYTLYYVPWEVPLPYGPLLWGPYAVPMLLGADVRFLTVSGELFVPVTCGVAAAISVSRGHVLTAASCLVLLTVMSFSPDLQGFASIGHTPVYWPLLALFAWLVAGRHWSAAALMLGLLIAARTTMIAIAPVLLVVLWLRHRKGLITGLVLIGLGAGVPFLPFALWDLPSLTYAMYGSYQNVMKTFVWSSTTWAQHTVGITGVLLTQGLNLWVEGVQLVVMTLTYTVSWFAIRSGRSPLAWMSIALLAFSMTTLWPVSYIYLDVLVLMVAALVVETLWLDRRVSLTRIFGAWGLSCAATVAVVAGVAAVMLPALPVSAGVTWREDPPVATSVLVRRSTALAVIEIETGAATVGAPPVQSMDATLNGEPLGTYGVASGPRVTTLVVPRRLWQIGANKLDLVMPKPISITRVTVRSP